MPTTVTSTSTVSVMSNRRPPTLTPTASDTGEGSSVATDLVGANNQCCDITSNMYCNSKPAI